MSDDGAEAAGIPPLGVKPNLINPSSLYPQILSTVLLCTILTTIFTFARLFTKFVISAWALEDREYSLHVH